MLHPKSRIHLVPVVAVALALVLVLAAAPAVATAASPSMPKDVQMVLPDPSLPKELAALGGEWEGSGYDSGLGTQIQIFIIVEKIAEEKATLYVWHSVHGWNRREANVTKESGKYKLWYAGPFGRNEITSTGAGLVFDAQPSWFNINLKRVAGQGSKKTITLPNGEVVWDLNGEWDVLVENYGSMAKYGSYPQMWKITQDGISFKAVRLLDDPGNPKNSQVLQGEIDKSGIRKVAIWTTYFGTFEAKGQISDDGKKIRIDSDDKVRFTATSR